MRLRKLATITLVQVVLALHSFGQDTFGNLQTKVFQVPPASASTSHQTVIEEIAEANGWPPDAPDTAQRILDRHGIPTPTEGKVIFNPSSQTLTVRNTTANLNKVASIIAGWTRSPVAVTMVCHLIEAPSQRFQALTAQGDAAGDQSTELQKILAESQDPASGVTVVDTSFLEMPSDHRGILTSATEHIFTSGVGAEPDGSIIIHHDRDLLGMHLELEPRIAVDQKHIDLNLTAHYTPGRFAPPQEIARTITKGEAFVSYPQKRQQYKVSTSLEMHSGHSRMLALWNAEQPSPSVEKARSRAAFITLHVVKQSPLRNPSHHIISDSPEMIEATFEMPGSLDSALGKIDLAKILSAYSITLPPDSLIEWITPRRLHVRSSPEVMDVLKLWHASLKEKAPTTVAMTLHIIRAPGSLLRPLLNEMATSFDHTSSLSALIESAKLGQSHILQTAHMESRLENRASFTSGSQREYLEQLTWCTAKPPVMVTGQTRLGCTFTAYPELTSDRHLNIRFTLENQTAPTSPWREIFTNSSTRNSFVYPREDYHRATLETSAYFPDSGAKLIGLWKPTGLMNPGDQDVLDAAFLTCHLVPHDIDFTALPEFVSSNPQDSAKLVLESVWVPPHLLRWCPYFIGKREANIDSTILGQHPPLHSSDASRLFLAAHGINLPEGSSATFSPFTQHLVITSTLPNLGRIRSLIQKEDSTFSRPTLKIHLFQADGPWLRDLLRSSASASNHANVLAQLLDAQQTKKHLVILGSLQKTAPPPLPVTVARPASSSDFSATPFDASFVFGSRLADPMSLSSRAPPVVSSEPNAVLHTTLTFPTSDPSLLVESLGLSQDKEVTLPLHDVPSFMLETTTIIRVGAPRILAVWRPAGPSGLQSRDVLQIAILERIK